MRGEKLRGTPHLMVLLAFACVLILGSVGIAVPGTYAADEEGLFLVARRDLSDPLFKESVVLMLPRDKTRLVVGLIVNKPARTQLQDLFPKVPILHKEGPAYFGGPVEVGTRGALFRSTSAPKEAVRVFDDVYVTFEAGTTAALAEGSQDASAVHFFLGRSQWSTVQLRDEIGRGSWYTLRNDADPIFSSHPQGVWRALMQRLEPPPVVQYAPPRIRITPDFAQGPAF